jgi:hypothetical protein
MRHLESDHQIALIQWCATIPILRENIFHIPNGGARNAKEGARLKAEGVKSGVSDLFLAYAVYPYHGCWLELKAPIKSAKLSPSQLDWLTKQHKLNYCIGVCFGITQAVSYLEAYLRSDYYALKKYLPEINTCAP